MSVCMNDRLIKTDWREEVKRGVEAARQHTAHEEYVLEMSRSAGALSPMGGGGHEGGGASTPSRGFFGGRMRSEYKLGSRAGVYINASRLHELRAPEESSNSVAPAIAAPSPQANGPTNALMAPTNYGTNGTAPTVGVAINTGGTTGGTTAGGAPVKWSPPSSPSTQSRMEHKLRLSSSSPAHAAHTNSTASTPAAATAGHDNDPTAPMGHHHHHHHHGASGAVLSTPMSAAALAAAAGGAHATSGDYTGSPERLTVITGSDSGNGVPVIGTAGALGELRSPEYRPSSRANPSRFKGSPTPPGMNPEGTSNNSGNHSGGNGRHDGHGTGNGNNAVMSPLPPDILPIRVLLVEDNAVNRKLGLHILARTGLEPDAATDGLDCVHKCNNHQYDLILMDVQMPRMDGIQATQALRARGLVTPIVALTANAMASERTKCIASGMDEFVTKPFKPEQLLTVVLERAAIRVPRWASATFSSPSSDHPLGPSSSADPGDHARPPAVRDEAAWLCEQRERRTQVLRALWERERPARARKLKGPSDTKTNGGQAPPPTVSAAVARRAEKRMSSGSAPSAASSTVTGTPTITTTTISTSTSASAAAAAAMAGSSSLPNNHTVIMTATSGTTGSPVHASSPALTPTRRSGHGPLSLTPSQPTATTTSGSSSTGTVGHDGRLTGTFSSSTWDRKRSDRSDTRRSTEDLTTATSAAARTLSPMVANNSGYHHAAAMASTALAPQPPPTVSSPTPPQHFVIPISNATTNTSSVATAAAATITATGVVPPVTGASVTPSSDSGVTGSSHTNHSGGDDIGDDLSIPLSDIGNNPITHTSTSPSHGDTLPLLPKPPVT
jgi:CheY-like chemotaxis protein